MITTNSLTWTSTDTNHKLPSKTHLSLPSKILIQNKLSAHMLSKSSWFAQPRVPTSSHESQAPAV